MASATAAFCSCWRTSRFAFACNTYDERTVAQHCSISYLRPGKLGMRLVATARGAPARRPVGHLRHHRDRRRRQRGRRVPRPFPRLSAANSSRSQPNDGVARLSPRPGDLDPIELASRDEIAALQTERMAWTLRHAYANVPHYRAAFDAAGVSPAISATLDDLAKFPVHTQGRPAGELSVRHVRRAARARRAHPRLLRHHRQADGGRLHAGRHRHLGGLDGALDPRRRRTRRGHASTTPMATACSPAGSAPITAPNGSAARWCRFPAAAPSGRSS